MAKDEDELPRACNTDLRGNSREAVDWGLIVFLILGVAALLAPHVSIAFLGVYWAAVVAVVVFVVWVTVMPTTCMSGGLICSFLGMMVLVNTIAVVLIACVRLAVSFMA